MLSGTCTVNGSGVDGAVIRVVDVASEEVLGTTTSDSSGAWSIDPPTGRTVHVIAEYTDSSTSTDYHTQSYPYITT